MAESITMAVIGLGRIGAMHAENVAGRVPGVRLAAVCDPHGAARERAASAYGVPAFADVATLLEQPGIDAVLIATPTLTHADLISAAVRAGKHVFSEKPIGLTMPESDAVLQQVIDAGITFQIGFQRRWDADYVEARRQVASGAIGRPAFFRGLGRDPEPAALAYHDPANSGGIFLDAAIHDYDAARFLMGREITAVSAHGANLVHMEMGTVGDVDTGVTILTFAGGGMGVTEWNRFSVYGYDTFAEVQGSEGAVRVDVPPRTQVLTLTRAGQSHEFPRGFPDRFGPAYCAEIAAFARAVREERPSSPGVEDARWALHVALCARASFDSGAVVDVPPLAPLKPAKGYRNGP